jgi:hypothetical protein
MFTGLRGKPLHRRPIRTNATIMNGDRIALALVRIASASSRIESAAGRAQAPDPDLSRKYETLREETGRALADLDHLIEKIAK